MIQIPIRHSILMLASMVALMFMGSALMLDPRGVNNAKHSNALCLTYCGKQFPLFMLLIFCCAVNNLQNFIGLLAILWSVLLLVHGYGDTRYVAKKFAACHFFALVLCTCASILSQSMRWHISANVLYILGFGILMSTYPLSSWIDSFFSRAPSLFLNTWLIIIRPIMVLFFLSTIGPLVSMRGNTIINFLLSIMVYSTLGFVPILFFTKTKLRALMAYMACWQSGYIWFFTMYLPMEKFDLITPLAITQGIFMAITTQVTTALYKDTKTDSFKNLEELFEKNYFAAIFIISAMVFLTITPLVFIYKKNTSPLPPTFMCQILASMVLPMAFNLKIYKLMGKPSLKTDKVSL